MSKKTDSEHSADPQSGDAAQDAPPITDSDLHNAIDQAATPEPTEAGDDAVSPAATDADADPLAAITAERDALKDQLLRALADTENMRRRSEREAETARKYGHTQFARDLVGAIDNLARALQSAPEDKTALDESVQSLLTGIELSWTEIQTAIEKHGVRQINPLGEKFDYNFHQAMFEVPTNDQPVGMVLEVVQHGYALHDRLLRPAMVGVSKAADAADTAATEKE
ncbi:MAG: nucleotide exchange factor GrpE [Candidatus Puniceispirillum sp.]|nr:nucleotide exchange factor GrpE [Candidatus Puniceispirillum sp.]